MLHDFFLRNITSDIRGQLRLKDRNQTAQDRAHHIVSLHYRPPDSVKHLVGRDNRAFHSGYHSDIVLNQ